MKLTKFSLVLFIALLISCSENMEFKKIDESSRIPSVKIGPLSCDYTPGTPIVEIPRWLTTFFRAMKNYNPLGIISATGQFNTKNNDLAQQNFQWEISRRNERL